MRTRHGARTILAALVAVAFTAIPAGAQTVETEGRFHVVWEDPPEGLEQARMHFFLSEAGNRLSELDLSPSILQWMGNPQRFEGQAVRVQGRDRGRVPGAAAPRLLEVSAFDPIAAPSIEGFEGIEAVTGTVAWVNVLCKFPDYSDAEPHPVGWYESLIEGTSYPGLDHYWRETSFENISTSGSAVFGWYTLPEPRGAYVNGSDPDLRKLRDDCMAQADAEVYYPDYEGVAMQFNASIGGASWGGRNTKVIDGVGKTYAMTWMADWADQFTYAHEQGHGLGLPHSSGPYGGTYSSKWDVMSGARNYRDPTFDWIAPHTISYHKNILGWIPGADRYVPGDGTSQTIELDRLADATAGTGHLMIEVPLPDGTFYTVESRRFLGYDTYLRDEVVIIHHVDELRSIPANLVDIDNDGDPYDEGVMWYPGETFEDATIGLAVHIDAETTRGHRVTVSLGDPGTDPEPQIALSKAALAYETPEGTDPADDSFGVTNSGGGTLDYTVSSNRSWLGLSRTSGSLAAGASENVTVSVDASGLAVGESTGTITVGGNGANAPQTVAVTVTVTEVVPDPQIALSKASLAYETPEGTDPADDSFGVTNSGGGTLDYTVSSNRSWLGLSRSSGSLAAGASENVTVSVDASGLAVGESTGTITVGGNGANAPQTVAVTVTVTEVVPDPQIALSTASLAYETPEGTDPADDSFGVTNSGGGTLDYTVSSNRSWLGLSRTSGSLAAGASENVTVSVDASGLAVGESTGTITVGGNGANAPQTVAVTVTVTEVVPDPQIALSTASLAYETPEGTDPADDSFGVTNSGGGTLDYTVSSNRSWLGLSRTSGSLAAGASQNVTVSVDASGLAVGESTGTITVGGNGANAPQTVAVTVTVTEVVPDPQIALSKASLAYETPEGTDPADESFGVTNSGGGTLDYTVSSNRSWLGLSRTSGSLAAGASENVTVSVDASGLAVGESTGTITVGGNGANAPQTVAVTVTVTEVVPDPQIALSKASLAYETPEGTDPADESFGVTNSGGGTLDYTVSSNRSWLGLSRTSGSLAAGASENVTVSVDASGLAVGESTGTITVGGNGANAPQTVAVTVTVTAPPSGPMIAANPADLSFQVKGKKAPGPQALEIRNDGAEALSWTASASQPWLSVGTSSGTLSGGGAASVSVEVSIADLAAGTYDGEIVIAGNADNAPQTVPVQLKMTKGGVVKIRKGRMTFAGSTEEQPLQKYVQLENDGDDSAVWTAAADQPWITLGETTGTLDVGATHAVTLDVDLSSVPPGYHAAQIEFEGGDDGLPDTLQVELMVTDGPGVRQNPRGVAAHLLGASQALTESELDYLDFAGNGDGMFDVGDLRAWLIQSGKLGPDALLLNVQPGAEPRTTATTDSADLPAPGRESGERRER